MEHKPVSPRVVEGEVYGAPVPGGWPDKGPLRVIAGAFSKFFVRRYSASSGETRKESEIRGAAPTNMPPLQAPDE